MGPESAYKEDPLQYVLQPIKRIVLSPFSGLVWEEQNPDHKVFSRVVN